MASGPGTVIQITGDELAIGLKYGMYIVAWLVYCVVLYVLNVHMSNRVTAKSILQMSCLMNAKILIWIPAPFAVATLLSIPEAVTALPRWVAPTMKIELVDILFVLTLAALTGLVVILRTWWANIRKVMD